MNEKVEKYLKTPNAKAWASMRTEEQRFIERQGKGPKKAKAKKVDPKAKGNDNDS
tara:strand:- start:557 stop:721 length:165 start_codon:yes stop_codon:yes gene_type:complete